MALQDLTPQLRTRLRRVEWVVVMFLAGTALLALCGLGWFIKSTGDKRGWWVVQVPYYTYLNDGGTVKVGTPVKRLGFTIGEVVSIESTDDNDWNRSQGYNVFVRFLVRAPYHGYLFTDCSVKVAGLPIDIAGGSFLDVVPTRGSGLPTTSTNTPTGRLGVLSDKYAYTMGTPAATNHIQYATFKKTDKGYFLRTEPAGDLIGELTFLIPKIREAFSKPGGLGDLLIPTNLASRLDRPGGLGDLVLPTNLNSALHETLTNLNRQIGGVGSLVTNLDQTLPPLLTNLNQTLPPLLAELTPTMSNLNLTLPPLLTNLNTQIADVGPLVSNLNATLPGVLTQANLTLGDVRTNTLPAANQLLTNSAEFVGGLKRHWLFRGAFKTNAPKVKSN